MNVGEAMGKAMVQLLALLHQLPERWVLMNPPSQGKLLWS